MEKIKTAPKANIRKRKMPLNRLGPRPPATATVGSGVADSTSLTTHSNFQGKKVNAAGQQQSVNFLPAGDVQRSAHTFASVQESVKSRNVVAPSTDQNQPASPHDDKNISHDDYVDMTSYEEMAAPTDDYEDMTPYEEMAAPTDDYEDMGSSPSHDYEAIDTTHNYDEILFSKNEQTIPSHDYEAIDTTHNYDEIPFSKNEQTIPSHDYEDMTPYEEIASPADDYEDMTPYEEITSPADDYMDMAPYEEMTAPTDDYEDMTPYEEIASPADDYEDMGSSPSHDYEAIDTTHNYDEIPFSKNEQTIPSHDYVDMTPYEEITSPADDYVDMNLSSEEGIKEASSANDYEEINPLPENSYVEMRSVVNSPKSNRARQQRSELLKMQKLTSECGDYIKELQGDFQKITQCMTQPRTASADDMTVMTKSLIPQHVNCINDYAKAVQSTLRSGRYSLEQKLYLEEANSRLSTMRAELLEAQGVIGEALKAKNFSTQAPSNYADMKVKEESTIGNLIKTQTEILAIYRDIDKIRYSINDLSDASFSLHNQEEEGHRQILACQRGLVRIKSKLPICIANIRKAMDKINDYETQIKEKPIASGVQRTLRERRYTMRLAKHLETQLININHTISASWQELKNRF